MKEVTATESGCGPLKVLLNSWRKGMKESGAGSRKENTAFLAVEKESQWRAVETQELEDKAHISKGRNGVGVVNESHGVRGVVRKIASTSTFSKFGVKRSKEAME
jgi:hypothetical protein